MGRLFGTDGIRGVAGKDLTSDLVTRVACAAAINFSTKRQILMVGRDTRISGPMLEKALSDGFTGNGWDVVSVGIIPTPGLARLCKDENLFGAVISASHNPIEYNGIKFFSPKGEKLTDNQEDEIEALIPCAKTTGQSGGIFKKEENLLDKYIDDISSTIKVDLSGKKVVLDCAYGATYKVAPTIFRKLGASVIALGAEDDGSKINVNCGSTSPEVVCKAIKENKADIGFAFDGDGDRVIACDRNGNIVDGDKIMGILAIDMKNRGRLPGNLIITTVMTNMGLEEFLGRHEIHMKRAKVGDRYVHQMMFETGSNLGGEQSGHIIIKDRTNTGDGTLSAISLLESLDHLKIEMGNLIKEIPTYPQTLVNITVKDKEQAMKSDLIKILENEANQKLDGKGRILIRPSGTEPFVRVMVEASEQTICDEVVKQSSEAIRQAFGI